VDYSENNLTLNSDNLNKEENKHCFRRDCKRREYNLFDWRFKKLN